LVVGDFTFFERRMPDRSEITKFTAQLKSASQPKVPAAKDLRIKIFADGANKETMLRYYREPFISGFTTNPTLMRKAGIASYEEFALDIIAAITDRPISFEVFSDDFAEMEKQAHTIASWGKNAYVKIPITNTSGDSSVGLIERLSAAGIKLNVTAMTLYEQVEQVGPVLAKGCGGIISVFAGRIADAGYDPLPVMKKCVEFLRKYPNVELLWASPREVYNLVQADMIGCQIITVTEDILKKLPLLGGKLDQVSLDTVRMFYNDAQAAGYKIRYVQSIEK
jgi:transaldolase